MRNIIKLTGLAVLIVFGFFYTDKVVGVIRENDSLMIEIENVQDRYRVDAIDGMIDGKTIVPGLNGREVNVDKSYKKMREVGVFNDKLMIYNILTPKVSISDNRDKFIVRGNNNKAMVSLVFIVNDDKYFDKVVKVSEDKDVVFNYFVDYDYLVSNSTLISKVDNGYFYNYGNKGEYSPDNLIFANNLISRITKKEAIYCLSKDKSSKVISLCSENDFYTVSPEVVIQNNLYSSVKKKMESGSIILIELNRANVLELGIVVDYIKGKGLRIGGLSELLSEELMANT